MIDPSLTLYLGGGNKPQRHGDTEKHAPMEEGTAKIDLNEAQSVLEQLAAAFPLVNTVTVPSFSRSTTEEVPLPESEARYQTLIEQIPAVVFMAFLDKGIG